MSEITRIFLNENLARYRIEEKLGAGGMARVYKAYDTTLERPVAIKILHEHLSSDDMFVERFKREAKLVAAYNHPNIVQIYDFNVIETQGNTLLYMVMTYLPGRNLHELLADLNANGERLPPERVLQIMLDLTAALSYAHERGMIHRDVKPANILFDEQGRAILTDFGIARMAENSQLTQEGVTVGTPAYMSPEQATGFNVDSRTDLYALGVILYEMLAGAPPFADEGSLSVLLKHLNEPVPTLSEQTEVNNPYLDTIIFKTLAKDPDDRYQVADELAEDLKAAFSTQPPMYASGQVKSRHLRTTDATIEKNTRSFMTATATTINQTVHIGRSPVGILAVGLLVIAVLVGFSLFNQRGSNRDVVAGADGAAANAVTEAEISAVDSMVAMTVYFQTDFTQENTYTRYWPQDDMVNLNRQITPEGVYRIESRLSGQAVASVFEIGVDYINHALALRGMLEEGSSQTSAYGLIFRYVDDQNYNVFAVDGAGRYSIWVRDDGRWQELRNAQPAWTRNNIINTLGTSNDLMLEIVDNRFIAYVNGEMVAEVTDDTILTGKVGIYIATPANGRAVVSITDYMVRETLDTIVESMTGGDLPEVDSMTGDEVIEAEASP